MTTPKKSSSVVGGFVELKQARDIVGEIVSRLDGQFLSRVEDIQIHKGRIRANFKGLTVGIAFYVSGPKTSDAAFTIKRDGVVEGVCVKRVLHIKNYYRSVSPWYQPNTVKEGMFAAYEGVSLLLDPDTLSTEEGKKEVCRFLTAGVQTPGNGSLLVLT